MPSFYVTLEVASRNRKIIKNLTFDLPDGSEGVDVVRAAEAYATSRGWDRVSILTSTNGAVADQAREAPKINVEDLARPLPTIPSIRDANWRKPLPRGSRRNVFTFTPKAKPSDT